MAGFFYAWKFMGEGLGNDTLILKIVVKLI
jgi:hypothetical protein